MKKILLVEDDDQIRNMLRDFISHSGMLVCPVERGDEALEVFRREKPDLVILDLNLPGRDGMLVCGEIRGLSLVPVIMLTARREEYDQIKGYQEGADDYVVKPFSPRVLMLKIQKMLERPPRFQPEILRFGDLEFDLSVRTLARQSGGEVVRIDLTPAEFNLFLALVQNPRKAFSRDELIDLMNEETIPPDIYDRTVDSHIKNLRKKLGPHEYIETIRSLGYKAVDSRENKS